jgi:hypothetical protein
MVTAPAWDGVRLFMMPKDMAIYRLMARGRAVDPARRADISALTRKGRRFCMRSTAPWHDWKSAAD